eukprot:6285704-Pyramimonas_sp.AAC.1
MAAAAQAGGCRSDGVPSLSLQRRSPRLGVAPASAQQTQPVSTTQATTARRQIRFAHPRGVLRSALSPLTCDSAGCIINLGL